MIQTHNTVNQFVNQLESEPLKPYVHYKLFVTKKITGILPKVTRVRASEIE